MSEFVSAGTTGVIVDEGGFFSGPMRVKFDGVNEIMDVQDDEIRTSCVSCGVASVVVSAVVGAAVSGAIALAVASYAARRQEIGRARQQGYVQLRAAVRPLRRQARRYGDGRRTDSQRPPGRFDANDQTVLAEVRFATRDLSDFHRSLVSRRCKRLFAGVWIDAEDFYADASAGDRFDAVVRSMAAT